MKEFEKIIGYQSIKKELETLVDIMTNSEKYQRLGVKLPRGILLYGDPGVGKTLMANCLINASGRTVITLRKDKPDGDFVKAIQDSFEKAKECVPCIVFLDDVDKFSSTARRNSNEEEFVTIQTCIDDTREYDIFVVATANDIDVLPDSLTREGRLGRKIHVRNPQGNDAVKIIEYYLSQKKFMGDVNASDIAKMLNGDSCADLESIINEAGIYAGIQGKTTIDISDILRGIMRIKFSAPESDDELPESVLKSTAYHEAGHAVVAEILEPGSVGLVSVLAHEGNVKGVTNFYQDDSYWDDKCHMETRVISVLGGKAATEIVFGKVDVGANSDLHRAFDIVERFVDDYCSVSFDSFERYNCSDGLKSRKDVRTTYELERFYAQAKRIIIENRAFLDAVAQALVEKKTLVSSDIQKIKESVA